MKKTIKLINENKDSLQTYGFWEQSNLEDKVLKTSNIVSFFNACDILELMLYRKRELSDPRLQYILNICVENYNEEVTIWRVSVDYLMPGVILLLNTLISTKQEILITKLCKKITAPAIRSLAYGLLRANGINDEILNIYLRDKNAGIFDYFSQLIADLPPNTQNFKATLKVIADTKIDLESNKRFAYLYALYQQMLIEMNKHKKITKLFLLNTIFENYPPAIFDRYPAGTTAFTYGVWVLVCLEELGRRAGNETHKTYYLTQIIKLLCSNKLEFEETIFLEKLLSSFLQLNSVNLKYYLLKALNVVSDEFQKENTNNEFDCYNRIVSVTEKLLFAAIKGRIDLPERFIDLVNSMAKVSGLARGSFPHNYTMEFLNTICKVPANEALFDLSFLENAIQLLHKLDENKTAILIKNIKDRADIFVFLYKVLGQGFFEFLPELLADPKIPLSNFLRSYPKPHDTNKITTSIPIEALSTIVRAGKSYKDKRNFLILLYDYLAYSNEEWLLEVINSMLKENLKPHYITTLFLNLTLRQSIEKIITGKPFCFFVLHNKLLTIADTSYLSIFRARFEMVTQALFEVKTNLIHEHNAISDALKEIIIENPTCNYEIPQHLVSTMHLHQKFNLRLVAANLTADAAHQMKVDEFLSSISNKLNHMYLYLGDKVFEFLLTYVATSLLPLGRFLSAYSEFDEALQKLCKKYLPPLFPTNMTKSHAKLIENIMMCLGNVNEFANEGNNFLTTIEGIFVSSNNLEEISFALRKYVFDAMATELNCKSKTYSTTTFEFVIENFSNILNAKNKMKINHLKEVFDEILKNIITSDTPLTDLFTDLHQDNVTGKKIAAHNKKIRNILTSRAIDVTKAINYKHVHPFSYENAISQKIRNLLILILRMCLNLTKRLDGIKHDKLQPYLNSLRDALFKLQIQLFKNENTDLCLNEYQKQEVLDLLLNESNFNLLKKCEKIWLNIMNRFEEFKTKDFEAVANLCVQLSLTINYLEVITQKTQIKQLSKVRNFKISQWNKDRANTMLLGNYVSCCLSTDEEKFTALVERWLDAAMIMHVIHEEGSQNPCSLAWMFLAEDINNPNSVIVVVNFFELHNGLSRNQELVDLIAKEYLQYIGYYARDIGAKRVLIREARYGSFEKNNVLSDLQTTQCNIDKIGPYFGEHRYYLNAVYDRDFFELPIPKLESTLVQSTNTNVFFNQQNNATVQNENHPQNLRNQNNNAPIQPIDHHF